MKFISSRQNPQIRFLQSLEKKRERDASDLFVVEGERELGHAIHSGYALHSLFFQENRIPEAEREKIIASAAGAESYLLSESAFAAVSYRESTSGLLALVKKKPLRLSDLKLPHQPLILLLEHIEKPGNLGAILRTADAVACDAVIVCDPATDIYNPNVIRSSIGAFFTNQLALCSSEEAIAFLKEKKIQLLVTSLEASHWYHHCDYRSATAIVMGSEAVGVSQRFLQAADQRIKIPMLGSMDSMNVSVSAAILLYEAGRQRDFRASKS